MKVHVTGFWKSSTQNKYPSTQKLSSLLVITLLLCDFLMTSVAHADDHDAKESGASSIWQELKEGFDYAVRVQGSGSYRKPAESSQNPDNDFLKLKQYGFDYELRPDLYLTYHQLDLMAKPRASLTWEKLDNDNTQEEAAWFDETWVNEYRIRYGISDTLFLSYGRENLQWGPTILVSPSNPFFLNTGRANSQTEAAGKGFFRLVYIPNMAWTLSLIANVDEGAYELTKGNFEEIYAFKLDYIGAKGYSSMILSHREHTEGRLGMFGALTSFDNTLIYIEGELSKENNASYPLPISRHPMGGAMAPVNQDGNAYDGTLIVGGSYTFDALPMLSLEYLYNSRGYSDEESEDLYALRRNAANSYYQGPYVGLARRTLGTTVNNGLQYLRQNYLFIQISRNDIRDVLDLRFILTYNMDDNSYMSILNIDYNVNDYTELYLNGISYHGSPDTEFSSMFDYTVSIGIKYMF